MASSWADFDLAEGWQVSGFNPDILAATPEDVWCAGGTIAWPTVAAAVSLVSTSAEDAAGGTGVSTVDVIGLDAAGYMQTEEVTLTGLVPALTANTFIRVNRIVSTASGSNGTNVGNISATIGGSAVCGVAAGRGLSSSSAFTVPRDYDTGYLVRLLLTTTYKGLGVAVFQLHVRLEGGPWLVVRELGVDGTPYEAYPPPSTCLRLPPMTDVYVSASVENNNMGVTAGYDILLRR